MYFLRSSISACEFIHAIYTILTHGVQNWVLPICPLYLPSLLVPLLFKVLLAWNDDCINNNNIIAVRFSRANYRLVGGLSRGETHVLSVVVVVVVVVIITYLLVRRETEKKINLITRKNRKRVAEVCFIIQRRRKPSVFISCFVDSGLYSAKPYKTFSVCAPNCISSRVYILFVDGSTSYQ